MGRYYFDKKQEADDLRKLSVFDLKRYKLLSWYSCTNITWTNSLSGSKNSITVESSTDPQNAYVRLIYTQTDYYTNEKKNFDYQIPLIEYPCNFGGSRYWFRCPIYTNGLYCGRRVATLYKGDDYFACRHCHNLSYSSRNKTRSGQLGLLSKLINFKEKANKLSNKIKRYTYRGKLTKNARQLKLIRYKLTNNYKFL